MDGARPRLQRRKKHRDKWKICDRFRQLARHGRHGTADQPEDLGPAIKRAIDVAAAASLVDVPLNR